MCSIKTPKDAHCILGIFSGIDLQRGNCEIQKTSRDRFMEKKY